MGNCSNAIVKHHLAIAHAEDGQDEDRPAAIACGTPRRRPANDVYASAIGH